MKKKDNLIKKFELFEQANDNQRPTVINNWKFNIKIKHLLSNSDRFVNPSEEGKLELVNICSKVISEISKLERRTENSNLLEDEKMAMLGDLEEVKSNFDFIKDLASGEIKESEWEDFGFNGNFQELFNDYLEQLYDICDKRVINKRNELEKFCFVN